jgi:preprotein translocase subunit SecF
MELFKPDININFMSKLKYALAISWSLIFAGLVSIFMHGGLKYGVDFSGGTLVQLEFKEAPNLDGIRDGLAPLGLEGSTIQEFGVPTEVLIRVQNPEEKAEELGPRIKATLEEKMKVTGIVIKRTEMVGPKVGKDLRQKAWLSILYSIIGIVIYIAWRFELRFAVGTLVSLIHDVTITVGLFSILDKEFDLVVIAAFLTLIGYSLNDTIVVFDRIRENMRRRSREPLGVVINASINQTLSRTTLTSGLTLLAVISLFFLGGEIIHNFAFTLLFGIITGTFSSIYIASPVVIYWEHWMVPKKG